jgi:hypothetical protein
MAHIIILLDESGSMNLLGDKPLIAVNNILNTTFENNNCYFSLYKFNNEVTPMFQYTPYPENFHYKPFGMTALFDALGAAIDTYSMTDITTICIVITDGSDNSSLNYNLEEIREKIGILENNSWSFIFMTGERNMDIEYASNMFGLPINRFLSFDTNTPEELLNVTQKITDEISTSNALDLFKNFNLN